VRNETIDRGIMERADNSAVVSIDIGWNDIGSWATLHDLLPHDGDGNVLRGEPIAIGTKDSLIHAGNKLIAIVGLRDVVVVDTGDALLICAKDRAQDVKEIVERLKQQKRSELV
jgi:mannose-1-phosphate guanylyltransferase